MTRATRASRATRATRVTRASRASRAQGRQGRPGHPGLQGSRATRATRVTRATRASRVSRVPAGRERHQTAPAAPTCVLGPAAQVNGAVSTTGEHLRDQSRRSCAAGKSSGSAAGSRSPDRHDSASVATVDAHPQRGNAAWTAARCTIRSPAAPSAPRSRLTRYCVDLLHGQDTDGSTARGGASAPPLSAFSGTRPGRRRPSARVVPKGDSPIGEVGG